METVLVNRADWTAPYFIPGAWHIANAPRPLLGEYIWTGAFRHGIFYAASPAVHDGTFGWQADGAYLVEFIDDAEIERRVLAKFAEYGYASADEAGVTIGEQAYCMQLPWHG
jgi:hypothetical protein